MPFTKKFLHAIIASLIVTLMSATVVYAVTTISGSSITGTSGTLSSLIVSGDANLASNTLYVDSANSRVGIGTTTPASLLNVVGTLGSQTPLFMVSSTTATNVVSPLLTVLANGNVGIGTTNPVALLDAYNNINSTPRISITNPNTGSSAGAEFSASGIDSNHRIALGIFSPSASKPDLGYVFADSGLSGLSLWAGGAEKVRIDNTGNVGIGTTTPLSKLQVSGALPKFYLSDTAGALNNKHWFMENNAGVLSFGTTTDALTVSGTRALTILNNGNVGIGTTTPAATLDIEGYMRLKKNASQPVACSAAYDSSIAVASSYMTCICNGTTNSWINAASSTQACAW